MYHNKKETYLPKVSSSALRLRYNKYVSPNPIKTCLARVFWFQYIQYYYIILVFILIQAEPVPYSKDVTNYNETVFTNRSDCR